MHPFFSQAGFKPPVLVTEDDGLQIKTDDSGIDVYENALASGVLLQNRAYLVETNTRFDQPLRCELFDHNEKSSSVNLNIMNVGIRCLKCAQLVERVVVPNNFPCLSISNQSCSASESCRMRCSCDTATELELKVTLTPLQSRDTFFHQQYDIVLPAKSKYRLEHILNVPVNSMRQNMNSVGLGEQANIRRFNHTMLFEEVGVSQLYEFPGTVMCQGVDVYEGALRNSFQMSNETDEPHPLRIRICSAHVFGMNFAETVRYFHSLYDTTYLYETTDIVAEHIVEWNLVRSQIDIVFNMNLTEREVNEAYHCKGKMKVAMFESLMSRHEIDEDDTACIPILILLRPNVAKNILETRIRHLDRDLPQRIGYDGAAVRWREDPFTYLRRESAQRIYRNALLIIHIWNYFRHTADYTWLESVGYPAIYSSAMFISEFRYTDPSSSAIRFRHVKNRLGVTVDNDLFTNRMCALALTYASTAAWKLNFKHQLVWEEYHLRESRLLVDIGHEAVPSQIFDATDKRLLVDVEDIKGMSTYVLHWMEDLEGETVTHRIGHRFGEECGSYILVNANTTMVQSQLVRTSYPLRVLNVSKEIIDPSEPNTEWSLDSAKTYLYKYNDLKPFFTITRVKFCQEFGRNVFHTTPPSEVIEKLDPLKIDSFVCISLGVPYSDYVTSKKTLVHAVDDHLSSVEPNDLVCMSANLGNMQEFQNIKEKWIYMNYAFNSILKGTHSSSKTIFGFLFGIMNIRFQGNTSSKGAIVEEYETVCSNDGIFPPIIDKITLHNISYLDTSIRNGLFKISIQDTDPVLYVLRYRIETEPPMFDIRVNLEAMGIAVGDLTYVGRDTNAISKEIDASAVIDEGTNYQNKVELLDPNEDFTVEVASSFASFFVMNLHVLYYDHDFARNDPLPNAHGALEYLFDEIHGNGVRTHVSLNTLDQITFLSVKEIRLGISFPAVYREARVELFDGTTSNYDVEGLSTLQLDTTLSSSVCGKNVSVMQITMFVVPGKEYLIQSTGGVSYIDVELLDASGGSVMQYDRIKRMIFDQTDPAFITYVAPSLPGQIDTRVFFDPATVPSSPPPFPTQTWYSIHVNSEIPQPPTILSEPSYVTNLLIDYGVQRLENYHLAEFDVSSQHAMLVLRQASHFESEFGSSFESVNAAISRHISLHAEFPVIWIRAFNTHIILCHSNYVVYGIGTHVNFHRMTQSRRIVLDDVEELESLRTHVSPPGRVLIDAQEGANGDSLRFAIRSDQKIFWWGIGTNYYNTLGLRAYDPLRHDLIEGTASLRNVQHELVYLDMLNEHLDTGYHLVEAVLPLGHNRSDEVVIYDKTIRTVHILGGQFSTRDWTSFSLEERFDSLTIHSIRYDNIEKRLLIGTTDP